MTLNSFVAFNLKRNASYRKENVRYDETSFTSQSLSFSRPHFCKAHHDILPTEMMPIISKCIVFRKGEFFFFNSKICDKNMH